MPAGILEVPGAVLSYLTVGSGPLLLFISGANGDASIWASTAETLAMSFTVCTYDRRGYRNSIVKAAQDPATSSPVSRDADDAAELIMHLSPTRPAYVLGSVSGGIVALDLLQRHPDIVRSMICHEPPLFSVLDPQERQMRLKWCSDVVDIYHTQGVQPAIDTFATRVGRQIEADIIRQFMNAAANKNETEHWLENEIRQYPIFEPNYDTLREHNSKLTLLYGRELHGFFAQRCTENIAKRCGAQCRTCPGGGFAYVTNPQEFAEAVVKILLPTPALMWPMFVP